MTTYDCVSACVNALDRLRIPYMVVGSFSSNVYGIPRSTSGADFVVQAVDRSIAELASSLAPDFEFDPQASFETVTATTRFRFTHVPTQFVIELFTLSDDPHDRQRFSRRVATDMGGARTFIPTAEDVIVTKLRWSRHGNRSKDVDDVRGILAVQTGRIDLGYVREWADQHGTRALLEQLLAE